MTSKTRDSPGSSFYCDVNSDGSCGQLNGSMTTELPADRRGSDIWSPWRDSDSRSFRLRLCRSPSVLPPHLLAVLLPSIVALFISFYSYIIFYSTSFTSFLSFPSFLSSWFASFMRQLLELWRSCGYPGRRRPCGDYSEDGQGAFFHVRVGEEAWGCHGIKPLRPFSSLSFLSFFRSSSLHSSPLLSTSLSTTLLFTPLRPHRKQ